mmetsp:Transcript_38540/g.108979  ORF Transcript_38540/g.108979 Transcript_38540/m.108979 type:complete len:254 (-) Transcript_38540:168-929(-)
MTTFLRNARTSFLTSAKTSVWMRPRQRSGPMRLPIRRRSLPTQQERRRRPVQGTRRQKMCRRRVQELLRSLRLRKCSSPAWRPARVGSCPRCLGQCQARTRRPSRRWHRQRNSRQGAGIQSYQKSAKCTTPSARCFLRLPSQSGVPPASLLSSRQRNKWADCMAPRSSPEPERTAGELRHPLQDPQAVWLSTHAHLSIGRKYCSGEHPQTAAARLVRLGAFMTLPCRTSAASDPWSLAWCSADALGCTAIKPL